MVYQKLHILFLSQKRGQEQYSKSKRINSPWDQNIMFELESFSR